MSLAADQIDSLRRALDRVSGASSDFDLNADGARPASRTLHPAGVLAAFSETPEGLSLVLTKRSSRLKHHPGQIAFPGGKQDDTDPDVTATALREAQEEVGLPPESVEVLGVLPDHETVTGFLMTPVIGILRAPFEPVPEPGEVEEVFTAPFAHVTDPARYSVQYRRWRGTRRHYYAVPLGPYYIWGATARILRGLAERVSA
ncbi:CoA pyrophosphatase [Cognatishimia sp. F0-27]|uniref:CoA pyrophosphatase n=1 Tax=Cognatishimia sp. F0-27 TaxID=2816855 RepID=UPI001D0CA274|nr:CoA pyrophosphatase [Cognatishimia sp. F0-27]MCC1492476.1 CoA pyrophosphatase [Cognatishimia sp. F0-27]